MSDFSVRHVGSDNMKWERVEVQGVPMDKAVVFEGAHDVRSAYFRMSAGCTIPAHRHTKWVQVMVLEGCMLVQQEGAETFRARQGSVYFVNPGFTHVETAEVECLLLVTQGEDRKGWM
jgi:quercetin dioxygenase-like cupin family protein